ncbi:MAG: hypothetical protein LUE64_01930, partial [Candidatus Gastranaerophilales bacterium]|nr:hypothetical protein [Candidatus Gastranaerophilales bacterium]
IINITPTKSITLKEIAETVNSIADKPVEIVVKNPVMNNEYTGNNELLLKNFPEMKFTDIHEGLEKLYRHIEKNLQVV